MLKDFYVDMWTETCDYMLSAIEKDFYVDTMKVVCSDKSMATYGHKWTDFCGRM